MLFRRARVHIRDLKRLQQVITILVRNGFGLFLSRLRLIHLRARAKEIEPSLLPRRIRIVLEELGPTFIKFGQIMSTRPDLIPTSYIEELTRLQDRISACSFGEIEREVEKSSGSSLKDIFDIFSREPLAVASLAQVHSATLKGGEAVVKVKRPGIEEIIEADISILSRFASLLQKYVPEIRLYKPVEVIKEFARTIRKELNFTKEGNSIERFRRNFKDDKAVYFPKVFWDYSHRNILTLEKIEGTKINELGKFPEGKFDKEKVAENLVTSFLKQVFRDGFFHSDPHPGNLIVLKDNRICFLDCGMVGRLSQEEKEWLSNLLIAGFKKDTETLGEILLEMGILEEDVPFPEIKKELYEILDEYYGLPLSKIEIAKLFQEGIEIARKHGLILPVNLILLGRALTIIEGITKNLKPDFNLAIEIKPFLKELLKKRYRPDKLLEETVEILSEWKRLIALFPKDVRGILRKIKENKLRIGFEHYRLKSLERSLDKASNRIAAGLVIAALIIGSSTIINVSGKGLSRLGIAGYTLAAILALWLLFSIFHSERL